MTAARKLTPAKGVRRSQDGPIRIVVSFDQETFEQIGKLAARGEMSFAEQVRILVEWGLDSA